MLAALEKIAKENGYRRFSATVLRENAAMLKVFKRRYPHSRTLTGGGSDITLVMDFADAVSEGPVAGGTDSADACACS